MFTIDVVHNSIPDADIRDVIKHLGPDELQKLFFELELTSQQIQKAKRSTDTHDVELQAMSVFELWRKDRGQHATHFAILDGLEECDNRDAKEELEKKWNITGTLRKKSISDPAENS